MATTFTTPITQTVEFQSIYIPYYSVSRLGLYIKVDVEIVSSNGEKQVEVVDIAGKDFETFYPTFDSDEKLYNWIIAAKGWKATVNLTGEPV